MRITAPTMTFPMQQQQNMQQQYQPSVLLYSAPSGDQQQPQQPQQYYPPQQEPVYYHHSVHQQAPSQPVAAQQAQPQQQQAVPPMYYYAPIYPVSPQYSQQYELQPMPLLQPYQVAAPQQAQHFQYTQQQAQQQAKQQQQKANANQREAEHSKQIHQKVQENEQLYVVHKIQPYDNLMSLAIAYNTTESAIMLLNNMISSDLGFYNFQELLIPKSDDVKPDSEEAARLQKLAEEKKHDMLRRHFKTATGEENTDVANYYLDNCNWESYQKAVEEYKKDLEWEKSQKQHVGGNSFNNSAQQKSRKNSANKGNWVSNLFKL